MNRDARIVEMVVASMNDSNDKLIEEIKRYEKDFPNDPETALSWKAFVKSREGDIAEAISLYSSAVAVDKKVCSLSRMSRAELYILIGNFEKALEDIEACLTDQRPIVKESFLSSLLYQRAFALAALGDPRFESAVAAVPPGYSEYRAGGRRDADGLRLLYGNRRRIKASKI